VKLKSRKDFPATQYPASTDQIDCSLEAGNGLLWGKKKAGFIIPPI
jgi:hypothetical protein